MTPHGAPSQNDARTDCESAGRELARRVSHALHRASSVSSRPDSINEHEVHDVHSDCERAGRELTRRLSIALRRASSAGSRPDSINEHEVPRNRDYDIDELCKELSECEFEDGDSGWTSEYFFSALADFGGLVLSAFDAFYLSLILSTQGSSRQEFDRSGDVSRDFECSRMPVMKKSSALRWLSPSSDGLSDF
jgi:hypothetical protein